MRRSTAVEKPSSEDGRTLQGAGGGREVVNATVTATVTMKLTHVGKDVSTHAPLLTTLMIGVRGAKDRERGKVTALPHRHTCT